MSAEPLGKLAKDERDMIDFVRDNLHLTLADAAAALGVDADDLARKLAGSPAARLYLAGILDAEGATLKATARVIADAHKADVITYFQKDGKVTATKIDTDHRTRLAAGELNLKARGELREGAQVQVNMYAELTDEQLAKIALGQASPGDFIPKGG